jgi:hypothetical protein
MTFILRLSKRIECYFFYEVYSIAEVNVGQILAQTLRGSIYMTVLELEKNFKSMNTTIPNWIFSFKCKITSIREEVQFSSSQSFFLIYGKFVRKILMGKFTF